MSDYETLTFGSPVDLTLCKKVVVKGVAMENGASNDLPKEQLDLTFRYYQEQWTHVRHHESLRSSLTVQVLVSAAAITAGYIQLKGDSLSSLLLLRSALSLFLVLIGAAGFLGVRKIEQTAKIHIKRARAARMAIGFLERFAVENKAFPSLDAVYLTFHVMVMFWGAALLAAAVVSQVVD